MPIVLPSVYPRSRRPCLNDSMRLPETAGESAERTPTRGTFPICCARAASGQATAPPITVINARRLIRAPHRHGRTPEQYHKRSLEFSRIRRGGRDPERHADHGPLVLNSVFSERNSRPYLDVQARCGGLPPAARATVGSARGPPRNAMDIARSDGGGS